MIKVIIRIGTDQIVEIGECHLEVECSMDRIIEEGQNMLVIKEMTLGEEIWGKCQIIESKFRGKYRVTIEMITLEEVEVGLGKDNIQVLLEGMTEVVAVGQDQVWQPLLVGIGLDVLNVGNMTILLKTVQTHKQRKHQSSHNKCVIKTKTRLR